MNGINRNNNADWMSRLGRSLKADPKRSGALAVLAVLLMVMVGRQVLSGAGKGRPQSAAASMVKKGMSFGPTAPGGVVGGKNSSGGMTSWQRSSVVSGAMQKWATAPVAPISRNLFAVRIEYFPVDGSRTAQSAMADEGFWSRLEKSMALQADQRDKQENLRANFKAQASKLRLESTMPGAQPRAMVNGELVSEGSVVAGFRVLKIEARRITVEREGIQLEIQMK
jgi:hypothetical protein